MSDMETGDDSGHSSPEILQDDGNGLPDGLPDGVDPSPATDNSHATPAQGAKGPLPLQKRRRVTRACDECRRKKIKYCTYDQPSNRRRNPAPQYIEALENRLQRAETLLKAILPEVDLEDPNFDICSARRLLSGKPGSEALSKLLRSESSEKPATPGETDRDPLLESMVETTGQLDLDDQGFWGYHGHSSGLTFLRRMREQFGDAPPTGSGDPPPQKSRTMGHVFDSPKSSVESPVDFNLDVTGDLPSRVVARQLCASALDDACALMRFVHQPSFYAMFDRIYDTSPDCYGNEENRYLPLLYVVLALGSLFAQHDPSGLDQWHYEDAIEQGFKYFKASRQMVDITDCRDLMSLQAIVFMIMFLQSSAKLSTCYSYIGIALRSSLRMGLHRSVSSKFDAIERESRKRVFWVIRKMDTYVGALLGLPQTLSDEDIDQEMPLEVEDQYITREGILPVPKGEVSLFSASNAHTKLIQILAKVIKYIYPIKDLQYNLAKSNQSYVVSLTKISELEKDLQSWMENLPPDLRPHANASPEIARVQQLLRMAYGHVQMVLYRPFLHYVSPSLQVSQTRPPNKRSYACAAACVSVSRNVIHITAEMQRGGLLIGAYWFTMYTTFFAILSLIYFVLENPDSSTSDDILREAIEGKDTLAALARRSMAADRCSATLTNLFSQLPDRIRRNHSPSTHANKKRHAPSPHPASAPAVQSAPDVRQPAPQADGRDGAVQRASTLPDTMAPSSFKQASLPYDNSLVFTDSSMQPNTYRRNSQSMFASSGISPTQPGNDPMSLNPSQSQLNLQQQQPTSGDEFQDLSAIMFPSTDPFAYPTQPMTTLDGKQDPLAIGSGVSSDLFMPNNSNNNNGNPYDNLEVSLFGPLPSYILQGQNAGMGMENMQVGTGGLGPMPEDIFAQQARAGIAPGMNLEEIFGGDQWNTMMMNPNFRS
ncbi:MAG: hypothetical protein M1819_006150 [Sarea resinae]|nr:MAG: hypothetical protein M1819_006150 [Sarea resinae]